MGNQSQINTYSSVVKDRLITPEALIRMVTSQNTIRFDVLFVQYFRKVRREIFRASFFRRSLFRLSSRAY